MGTHGDINSPGFEPDIASHEARFMDTSQEPPAKKKTTVINIRQAPANYLNDPEYEYIGRTIALGNRSSAPLGNPFSVDKYGRTECIQMYREHAASCPEIQALLPELQGKILVCHCKPLACHGDVLAKMADDLVGA